MDRFPPHPELFPTPSTPYIIVSPKYNPASAGIRALHMLCHSLNVSGQRAYLSVFPQMVSDDANLYTTPELLTPLLTPAIARQIEASGRTPIVLYAETVHGNPLNATTVVRWILNYPGKLGGDTTYAESEILYAYSKHLADHVGLPHERVIFLPTSDPRIFYPPPEGSPRSGSCFYAAKYQENHGGKLLPITEGSFEITRGGKGKLSKPEIADLLRRSEVFYAYEDTALAIEAGMCGCPTVFIPSDYMQKPLGLDDLGTDGIALDTSPEQLAHAKATVGKAFSNYQALIDTYWRQVGAFVTHTQRIAEANNAKPFPPLYLAVSGGRYVQMCKFIIGYIRRNGVKDFSYKVYKAIRARGLFNMVAHTLRNLFK